MIAPTVLGLGGQAVEALRFRTHGHKYDSHIQSSFFLHFLFLFFFVSRIRDGGPLRVNITLLQIKKPYRYI